MQRHDSVNALRRLAVGLASFAALAWIAPASAAADTAAGKAGRGLAAMTTGFLEVPGNIVETSEERGYAMGVPLGFAKGLGMIVVRELVGVYEFVTAPIPAPEGFQPILSPEYPWGYFEDGDADAYADAGL